MTERTDHTAIQRMQEMIVAATPTAAQAMANLEANMPALRESLGGTAVLGAATPSPTCHRCDVPATTQWQQHATPEAAEAHWAAQEQHIRSLANTLHPEQANYIADRTGTVTVAVHGCDAHVVDNAHLTHDADCGGHQACQCGGDRG